MPTSKDDELLRVVAGELDKASSQYYKDEGRRLSESWTDEFKAQIGARAGSATGSNTTPSKSSIPTFASAAMSQASTVRPPSTIPPKFLKPTSESKL